MKKFLLALALTFTGATAFATANNDASRAEFPYKNYLADKNPGFENGKAGWTASGGTFTTATSGSNFMGIGKASGTWDSNSAGQTFTSSSYTIGNGLAGNNGLFRCKVMTPSGTATHTMGLWDGSNLTNTISIPSSTTAQYVEIQAPFGAAATTVAIRFTSVNANEPLVSVDDCYIGPNINIGSISQAIFVGESYFAGTASCVWSRASATIGAFSTSATCPGPTVVKSYDGTWATTDVDLPIQTISNLPPGVYEATFQTRIANSAGAAVLAINDGTTTCEAVSTNDDTTFNNGNTVSCVFEYTTAGSHSFQLYGASTGGTINVNNTIASAPRASVKFSLRRFPSTSQMAVRADSTPGSWSGYHDGNCAWTTTSTSFADPNGGGDASCTFTQLSNTNFGTVASYTIGGQNGPGIVFTPNVTGKYFVCATASPLSNNVATALAYARLVDGSGTELSGTAMSMPSNGGDPAAMCGVLSTTAGVSTTVKIFTAASSNTTTIGGFTAARSIYWTAFSISQNLPAPYLVGSVTSSTTGMLKIETATVSGASPGVPSNMSSPWISGNCPVTSSTIFTCPILAGTFSGTPNCVVSVAQDSPIVASVIQGSTTSSQVVVRSGYLSSTGGVNISAFNVICVGPK